MKVVREIFLEDVDCASCNIVFACPGEWVAERRRSGAQFWCPNGHTLSFGDGENGRLRKNVEALRAQLTAAHDQREAAEREAKTARAEAMGLRKRVVNGVCPCCKRSFANVARHMKSKHPEVSNAD